MRRLIPLFLVAVALSAGSGRAEAQGGTDVWVASLRVSGSSVTLGRPRNVTARAGYDNQPSFTPDGRAVMYTRIENGGPADIWRVALAGGAPTRLTRTDIESEYSATPMPDGSGFSVIRVEADSTQRLWAFGWDGAPMRVILPALKPVGYHVWIGESAIGAFVLGSPNALVLADPRTERVDTLGRNIGRAFARAPGREAFTFVQVGDSALAPVAITEVDARTGAVQGVLSAPAGVEYHVRLADGSFILGTGSVIWHVRAGQWSQLADLGVFGVRGISRIAISPSLDQIAFVTEDAPAP